MKFQRIGGGLLLARLSVGILGVFILCVVGASFGQQPPAENLEPVPAGTRTPELSADGMQMPPSLLGGCLPSL